MCWLYLYLLNSELISKQSRECSLHVLIKQPTVWLTRECEAGAVLGLTKTASDRKTNHSCRISNRLA